MCEDCPLKSPITGYKEKFYIKTAPFVYVENLPTHIFGYLEKLDEQMLSFRFRRNLDCLTCIGSGIISLIIIFYRNNLLVRLKIGGDHLK